MSFDQLVDEFHLVLLEWKFSVSIVAAVAATLFGPAFALVLFATSFASCFVGS